MGQTPPKSNSLLQITPSKEGLFVDSFLSKLTLKHKQVEHNENRKEEEEKHEKQEQHQEHQDMMIPEIEDLDKLSITFLGNNLPRLWISKK